MHEHGLCNPVLQVIQDHLPADLAGKCVRVRLRVSEISGLTEPALQAAFDHAHASHEGPRVQLELRSAGLLGHCPQCARVVEVTPDLACARCGAKGVTLAGGETLLIEEISVVPAGDEPVAVTHDH